MRTRYYIRRNGQILSNNRIKFVYELIYEDNPREKYTAARIIDKGKEVHKDKNFDYFESLYYKAISEE